MEQINKYELSVQYCLENEESHEISYLAGFNKAEEVCSKQLEEKQELLDSFNKTNLFLMEELQKAKELLKEASEELSYYGDSSEDEFDIKEITEKIKNFLNK